MTDSSQQDDTSQPLSSPSDSSTWESPEIKHVEQPELSLGSAAMATQDEPVRSESSQTLAAQDVPATAPETGSLPALAQLTRTAFALLFEVASVVAAFQFAFYRHLPAFVSHNTMTLHDRVLILGTAGGGGALAVLLAGVFLLWKRSRRAVDQVAFVAQLGAPLMLAMGLPLLFNWRIFQHTPMLAVVVFLLYGLAAELAFQTAAVAFPLDWLRTRLRRLSRLGSVTSRWVPPVIVALGVVGFAVSFSYYTIVHHHRIQTQSLDMAIFNHMMWSLLRGAPFPGTPILGPHGTHLQYHATFVAVLLAPLYALYQRPEGLLVIQSTLCGTAAIPLYLLAKRRLESSWLAAIIAFAYLLYAPLHGPIFYDFHFLTLAPFFVFWVLYMFERGSKWGLVVMWIIALSLREDIAATLTLASLFYLVSGRRVWWAFGGGIASVIYFGVMKFAVMPAFRGGKETFTYIYAGYIPSGEHGFGAVLRTFFSNPVFTFNKVLESKRVIYLLQVLGPLLLLPLRNRRAWILLIFPALITVMSSGYKPVYQITFQYTAAWASFGLFATVVTLSSWKKRRKGMRRIVGSTLALLVASLLFSYHYGAILQHHTFRGGFRKINFKMTKRDHKRYADLRALIALIPPDAKVVATETEAPHVSSRRYIYTMRFDFYDADYMLVRNGEVSSNFSRKHFVAAVKTGKYGFVKRQGDFSLWKKGAPTDGNAAELKRIGVRVASPIRIDRKILPRLRAAPPTHK